MPCSQLSLLGLQSTTHFLWEDPVDLVVWEAEEGGGKGGLVLNSVKNSPELRFSKNTKFYTLFTR